MTTTEPNERARLREAHQRVLDRISRACARASRSPDEVALVAVSKTVAVERLRDAVEAGIRTLGENRVQEAEAKAGALPGAAWHLVGPLQSNKAKRAVELFAVIQTVGSVELAARIDRLLPSDRPRFPVLLQVNVDRDAAKAGFQPDDLEHAAEAIDALERLDVRGLMTVGRLAASAEAARPTFVRLRELSERLRPRWPALGRELSMGMSDDFEVAIEEGATIVRVGRALFGERPPAG